MIGFLWNYGPWPKHLNNRAVNGASHLCVFMFFTMAVRSVQWWISNHTYWATIKAMRIWEPERYLHVYHKTFTSLCFSVLFKTLRTFLSTDPSSTVWYVCGNCHEVGKGLSSYPSTLTAYLFAPEVVCRGNFSYTVICIPRQDVIITFKFWVDFMQLWMILTHSMKQSSIFERG